MLGLIIMTAIVFAFALTFAVAAVMDEFANKESES